MELLTQSETAKRLRVVRQTIARWAKNGTIPCIRMNARKFLFDWEDIEAALRKKSTTAKRSKPA